jgi:lariat debranching enzyme
MITSSANILFAAVGDVHGKMQAMVDLLEAWESRAGQHIAFVLQTGDFEPHRNEADLETMAAPSKYKQVGDFPHFAAGHSDFPWPVHFIGGNHEPYGFLDQFPHGARIAPNCHYLGRVEATCLAGLRIVSLTGVFREKDYHSTRPAVDYMNRISNKVFTAFTETDIERALSFGAADVLVLHDWPADIVTPADLSRVEQQCRRLRYKQLGNAYSRLLVELLNPQLVLCGHMHMRYETELETSDGTISRIYCLGRVEQGRDGFAVFGITPTGKIIEVT